MLLFNLIIFNTLHGRVVYCSKVYEHSDRLVVQVIASAVWKMVHSTTRPIPLNDRNRALIQLNESSWTWVRTPFLKNNFQLDFCKMPHQSTKKFTFLEDLDGGAEGRVWLACNSNGKVAAVKFRFDNDKQKLEARKFHLFAYGQL